MTKIAQEIKLSSFAQRVLVVLILAPIGLGLIVLGGWAYGLFVTLVLGIAAWEYWNLFRVIGYSPSLYIIIGGVVVLALCTTVNRASLLQENNFILALLTLLAMTYHLVSYEKGKEKSGVDFGITLGGILYLGLIGSYLISLRNLPDGKWWILLALPSVWIADSGAYFIGSRFGKHKLSPRLSPRKTWEGYFGGILFGVAGGILLGAFMHSNVPAITLENGALFGFILSVLTPLGDLGESMFKRQAGMKDSSHILPGHGGVLDRIDSWLWAAVIGYYLVLIITR
jgi:phosphatidate cytidylyltransferase